MRSFIPKKKVTEIRIEEHLFLRIARNKHSENNLRLVLLEKKFLIEKLHTGSLVIETINTNLVSKMEWISKDARLLLSPAKYRNLKIGPKPQYLHNHIQVNFI